MKNSIKCPCCGAEYLAGEIYYPKSFLGQPKFVDRDSNSYKITDYDEKDGNMNLQEDYVCDYCKTPFRVSAKVMFRTSTIRNVNFNEDYSTPLKKEKLFFEES